MILESEPQVHHIVTNILYRIDRNQFVMITNKPREYSRSIRGIIEELDQRYPGIGAVEYELYPVGLLKADEANAMTPAAFKRKPDANTLDETPNFHAKAAGAISSRKQAIIRRGPWPQGV